jgi:hypothetical protein
MDQMEVVFLVDLVRLKVIWMEKSLSLLFIVEVDMPHPREEKQFEDSKGTVYLPLQFQSIRGFR